ncbi:MAG TPA: DUF6544 family protein [Polyangiaceae bacterium]|nr:DUF6544 family protein [Polyangiaceae bacterium]
MKIAFAVFLAIHGEVVDASGSEMTRSETVTLFNDLCLLAPASLLSKSITWESLDEPRVRGSFTNAGNTVRAELSFDAAGDLVCFPYQLAFVLFRR